MENAVFRIRRELILTTSSDYVLAIALNEYFYEEQMVNNNSSIVFAGTSPVKGIQCSTIMRNEISFVRFARFERRFRLTDEYRVDAK